MPQPDVGSTWHYNAQHGLGAAARIADPDLDDHLPAEMHTLDMHPGMTVEVVGHDTDRDLILVAWTDVEGTPRTTSIDPAVFDEQFTAEG